MTISVTSPTSQRPKHDVTLTDGSTTVGFVLTDTEGRPNPRAITDSPQQRTAVKTSTGDSKYSDFQPPWGTWVQDDWSGGMGIRWADDDKSRFYTAAGVDSSKSGELTFAPRPRLSATRPWNKVTDYLTEKGYVPSSYTAMTGARLYYAFTWVAPTGMTTVRRVTIPMEVTTASSRITLSLHSDSAGSPGAQLTNGSKYIDINRSYSVADRLELTFVFDAAVTVVPATTYWIKVTGDDNKFKLPLTFTATPGYPSTCKESADNVTWVSNLSYVPFRINDDTNHDTGIFLEYKGAMYYITKPNGTFAAKMYLNGDRGAADANTGALTTLVDASKSWTADQWNGCIVKIISGPGSEEEKPWRYISDTTTTTLTLSEAWTIEHTTSTEYVIIDTDYWQEIEDFSVSSAPVACAVATDKYIYVGWGNSNAVVRYEAYNNAGTWADRTEAESPGGISVYAHKMTTVIRGDTTYLYTAKNYYSGADDFYRWAVEKFEVPKQWGELIGTRKVMIAPTDQPWDSDDIANVTQTMENGATKIAIAAGLTISGDTTVAVKNLDAPVDLTTSNYIGFYILSSTAVTADKIKVVMDDTPGLGKEVLPTAAFRATSLSASATYTAMEDAIDGSSSTYTLSALDTNSAIFIVADRKFDEILFDLSATVNNNAATLTFWYFNGADFVALTVSDGTASAGATLAQDGSATFTPPDDWAVYTVNDVTGYVVAFQTSAVLDDVGINNLTVKRQNLLSCTVAAALVANQWQWIDIAITPTEELAPNETIIQSIGLTTSEDNGAQNIYLRGGIWGIANNSVIDMPNEKIVNMLPYAGNSVGIENIWAFTDRGVYELQSENGESVTRLPIDELRQFSGSLSGQAACVNDVYLWFNMGRRVERYYLRNLDDLGPDKDEGLTGVFRDAIPVQMLSYPGRVYLAISNKNAINSYDTSGMFSSILVHRGGGWHSVHRSPAHSYIGAMYHQRIADRPYGWLWFQEDASVFRIKVVDDNYKYVYGYHPFVVEGVIETGWIHCGMMDVYKTFGDVKLFADYLNDTADLTSSVYLSYQKDSDTSWTDITSDYFAASPSDTVNLGITAKRLKLRLRLITSGSGTSTTLTPRIYALLLEYYAAVPVKYNYGWTSVLKEDHLSIDLQTKEELVLGYTARAETAYAQLKTWANAGTKLTLNSRYSVYDNKTVILNAPASQPIKIDSEEQREEILISVSAFDL